MLNQLPKKLAYNSFYVYVGVLLAISAIYHRYMMNWEFLLMGIISVSGFFFGSSYFTKSWAKDPNDLFQRKIFFYGLGFRVIWAVFAYFYYSFATGIPFEFFAGDSIFYYEESLCYANTSVRDAWQFLAFELDTVSDSGYLMYLILIQKIVGTGILPARLVNSIISALTCVLLYKLGRRSMGEEVGRMAAIFAMLFPNFIFYCGLHLKEPVMIFIIVAYLERADYLLREKRFNFINIFLVAILLVSLFFFRTALGGVGVLSFVVSLFLSSDRMVGKVRRWALIGLTVLAVSVFMGGTIATEVEGIWTERTDNQMAKRDYQVSKGYAWAKYATGSVMAPMMFILPFPTMVDVDEQYTQQMLSGGNFCKQMMAGYVLLALYILVFVRRNWRDFSLIEAFEVGYLGVICLSGFANSERFLLPGVPLILLLSAYGLSNLTTKYYQYIKTWSWFVPVLVFAWSFFKLGTRGLF